MTISFNENYVITLPYLDTRRSLMKISGKKVKMKQIFGHVTCCSEHGKKVLFLPRQLQIYHNISASKMITNWSEQEKDMFNITLPVPRKYKKNHRVAYDNNLNITGHAVLIFYRCFTIFFVSETPLIQSALVKVYIKTHSSSHYSYRYFFFNLNIKSAKFCFNALNYVIVHYLYIYVFFT